MGKTVNEFGNSDRLRRPNERCVDAEWECACESTNARNDQPKLPVLGGARLPPGLSDSKLDALAANHSSLIKIYNGFSAIRLSV